MNGVFNGAGGFSATEDDDWFGPRLDAFNGGQLNFLGSASHNGFTRVQQGTVVSIAGSFNQLAPSENFAVFGDDGADVQSELVIGDPANSNVECFDFAITNGSNLSLNNITTTGPLFLRGQGILEAMGNVTVGSNTSIGEGRILNVIGSFNQTAPSQNFAVFGDDGAGGQSELTIGNPAGSNVECFDFAITNGSNLSLNNITTTGPLFLRGQGILEAMGDVSVGSITSIAEGRIVTVGGSFNQSNFAQNFDIGGDLSALLISDVTNSNVECFNFAVFNASNLDLNSMFSQGRATITNGAQVTLLEDASVGNQTEINNFGSLEVGGMFTQTNSNARFIVSSTSNFVATEAFIDANDFDVSGCFDAPGLVTTSNSAILQNGCELSLGPEVGLLEFDVESIATAPHALTCRPFASLNWKLQSSGSDLIEVTGDLQIDSGFDIVLVNDGSLPALSMDSQVPVITYTGSLTATTSNGELTGVDLDLSAVKNQTGWDVTNARLIDDGMGIIFLTGIVAKGEDVLLGDVNCDGIVSLLDVGPFVDLLTNSGFSTKADINQDGVVDLLDVGPFVALLAG